jgi:hypothetical protein
MAELHSEIKDWISHNFNRFIEEYSCIYMSVRYIKSCLNKSPDKYDNILHLVKTGDFIPVSDIGFDPASKWEIVIKTEWTGNSYLVNDAKFSLKQSAMLINKVFNMIDPQKYIVYDCDQKTKQYSVLFQKKYKIYIGIVPILCDANYQKILDEIMPEKNELQIQNLGDDYESFFYLIVNGIDYAESERTIIEPFECNGILVKYYQELKN